MTHVPDVTRPAPDPLLVRGRAAFQAGRLAEAMTCCEAALAAAPDRIEALHLLALSAAKHGDTDRALALYNRAAALRPEQPEFPYQRAMILARGERLEEALAGFDATLRAQPGHAGALLNRAVALHRLGRLPAALSDLDSLLQVQPGLATAWGTQARVLAAMGRLDQAVAAQARGAALQPGDAPAQTRLATLLGQAGHLGAALAHFDLALAMAPRDAEALLGRARALQSVRRHEEAVRDLRAALASAADPLTVLTALATSLTALGDWSEAETCRNRAMEALDRALGKRPEDPVLRRQRANLLFQMDRFEAALAESDAAQAASDDPAQAWLLRGGILFALQREEEAVRCYAQALSLTPDAARSRYDASLHRLALGDMPAAWREHESRWRVPDFPALRRDFRQPLWLGQGDLAGRRVLLHAEQGLGDTLQFCRYAALVAAHGAEVLLEVQPPLVGLMRSLAGPARVLAQGAPLPDFDLHCPLLSLPLAFGTTLATIPASPSYLAASPPRLQLWRQRLGPAGGRRIGLVWAGNSHHGNDRRRSMPLAAAAPLLGLGAEVIGLQHEVPERDRATLASLPGLRMLGPECRDFEDTAALVSLLDVVITVDSSVAHLAGALGKPVLILLPQLSDWRWLLRREDSPWYPSARLFRQQGQGDWGGVIARVVAALVG